MLPSLLGNFNQQTSSSIYDLQRKSDVEYNSNSHIYSTNGIQQSSLSCYWCLDDNCSYKLNYNLFLNSPLSTGISSETSTAYKQSTEMSNQKQTSTDAHTNNSTPVSDNISSTTQSQSSYMLPSFLDWTSHLSKTSSTYPTYKLPAFQNWTSHVPMTHSAALDVDSQASSESYTLPSTPLSMTSSDMTTSCDDTFLDNLVYDVSVTLPDINYPVPVLPTDNSLPYTPLIEGTFTVLESKKQTSIKSTFECKCPNCLMPGGNNTIGTDGQPQHNCHFPNCKKVFSKATVLKAHLKTHDTNVHRPVCKICGRNFARNENLIRHMKIHFRDKDFVCPHCFDEFPRKGELLKHMRSKHEKPKKKKDK